MAKLTMERTETDTRQQLNNKIERLEAEMASVKTRLEQEVAQRHALGRSMDVCSATPVYFLFSPRQLMF